MTHKTPRGEDVRSALLSENEVKEIRKTTGVSQRELANRYGVSQSCIRDVLLRRKWKHL